jgi:hypothetical protein
LSDEGLELFDGVGWVVLTEVIVESVEDAEAFDLGAEDFGAIGVAADFGSGLKDLGAHTGDEGSSALLGFSAVAGAE